MSPILWVHYKEQTPGEIKSCRLFCMVSGRKWRISGAFKITADYLQAMGVTRARFGVWEQSFFLFLINPFFKEKSPTDWQAQQIHCWSSAKTQWKCSEESSIKQTHSSDFSIFSLWNCIKQWELLHQIFFKNTELSGKACLKIYFQLIYKPNGFISVAIKPLYIVMVSFWVLSPVPNSWI